MTHLIGWSAKFFVFMLMMKVAWTGLAPLPAYDELDVYAGRIESVVLQESLKSCTYVITLKGRVDDEFHAPCDPAFHGMNNSIGRYIEIRTWLSKQLLGDPKSDIWDARLDGDEILENYVKRLKSERSANRIFNLGLVAFLLLLLAGALWWRRKRWIDELTVVSLLKQLGDAVLWLLTAYPASSDKEEQLFTDSQVHAWEQQQKRGALFYAATRGVCIAAPLIYGLLMVLGRFDHSIIGESVLISCLFSIAAGIYFAIDRWVMMQTRYGFTKNPEALYAAPP